MTSLAALFDWLAADKAAQRARVGGSQAGSRLRALPKEEIHFYVKAVDNSRVVRIVDKRDWLQTIGATCTALTVTILAIALLLPGGYNLLMSRRVEMLKAQRDDRINMLRELRSEEAALLSPAQLQTWGGDKFVTPTAAAVIFAPPSGGTVASLKAQR